MKSLYGLVTAALLITSCASTPEEKRRQERADRVAALANSAGAHFGLSPLERIMLERKARQIAGSEKPLNTGLNELHEHPKLERKVGDFLEKKNAGQILDQLGRENPELKAEADKWLGKDPETARRVYELLGR